MKHNPRRTNSSKRNKIRARVLREQTHCWLCGQVVDTELQPGLPASPEVDEIIPVSKGGSPFDPTNVMLSHRLCNQKRGNKVGGLKPKDSTAFTPLKVSRKH